jgi:transposase
VTKAARSPNLLATRFITLIGKSFAAEAHSKKWTAVQRQRLRRRYSTRTRYGCNFGVLFHGGK